MMPSSAAARAPAAPPSGAGESGPAVGHGAPANGGPRPVRAQMGLRTRQSARAASLLLGLKLPARPPRYSGCRPPAGVAVIDRQLGAAAAGCRHPNHRSRL